MCEVLWVTMIRRFIRLIRVSTSMVWMVDPITSLVRESSWNLVLKPILADIENILTHFETAQIFSVSPISIRRSGTTPMNARNESDRSIRFSDDWFEPKLASMATSSD